MGQQGGPGTIGHYRVRSRLGWGGMGEVYLATAAGLEGVERPVAIKLIRDLHQQRPELGSSRPCGALRDEAAELVAMFIEEAKVSFLLTHPNVVQTYEIGQVDGHYFLVMEYIDGITLEELLGYVNSQLGQPLPVPFALHIAARTARGLGYAHELSDQRGQRLHIVHRDVSPGNILLSRDGQVKLADFGLAKSTLRRVESEVGLIKGKVAYMAPEQLAGAGDVGPAADLYALGVVLYEMLSGQNPFGEQHDVTPLSRRAGPVAPLLGQAPHLDPQVAELVERCLRSEPELRYSSAQELGRALDHCLRQTGHGASDYELAEFIDRAREMVSSGPAAPHPFDRALGMELQKVAGGEAGVSTFRRSSVDALRPPSTPMQGAESAAQLPSRRWPLLALVAAAVLVAGSVAALLWSNAGEVRPDATTGARRLEPAPDAAAPVVALPDARVALAREAGDTARTGTLHVRPLPLGGSVRVAGQARGTAPLSISGLPAGTPLRVEITLPGYRPYDQVVTLQGAGSLTLQPRLVPLRRPRARPHGLLSVNSEPWSIVYVDGARVRNTPLVRHSLVAGTHRVRLYNPVRKLSAERTVRILPERETRLSVELGR